MRLPDHPRDRFRLWAGATVGGLSLLTPVWALVWYRIALRTSPDPFGIWFVALGAAVAGPVVMAVLLPRSVTRHGAGIAACFGVFFVSVAATMIASMF